jgi:hypothetical protein
MVQVAPAGSGSVQPLTLKSPGVLPLSNRLTTVTGDWP